MAASVLNLNSSTIPHTLNYKFPDPACPVQVVTEPAQTHEPATVLMLNYSTSGQATAVVVKQDQ